MATEQQLKRLRELGEATLRGARNHLPPNLPPDGRRIALEVCEYAIGLLLAEVPGIIESLKPQKASIKTKKGAKVTVKVIED